MENSGVLLADIEEVGREINTKQTECVFPSHEEHAGKNSQ
jgi:hypothetical protein